MRLIRSLLGLFCLLFASASMVQAESRESIEKFQYKSALEFSQQSIGQQVSEWKLTSVDGRSFSLAELRGKPWVLSQVYTSCYVICPTTTRHLSTVIEKAREALGSDSFAVVTVGFDHRYDSPQAMAEFAKKQGIEDSGWHVLSADEKVIEGLSREVGFKFFTSPNGFDHVVQATVIDAEGVIYRQVYGEVFSTPLLIEPLKDLVLDRPKQNQTMVDELIDKVRFFCTSYDPATDSYYFDYSIFVGIIIGLLIMVTTLLFVFREYLRGGRKSRV